MAPRVTVAPGGQAFHVEGAEPILEAALRAGLAVAYGCASGNCGECKARVIEGRIRQLRPHDYRLAEAEKQQGCVLMCCATALTDLVIEAAVAHGSGDMPRRRIVARTRKLEKLSDQMIQLELATPRTDRLRFLAGQSAVLELGETKATLPIASCPCDDRRLHFHVRRDAADPVSDYVWGRLRIGEAVAVEGPHGDFVLRENGAPRMVFIAWGWQGFAPVKSVIEHALAQETAESIDLRWFAATAADHYHLKLCRAWADAMDNFRHSPVVVGPELDSGAAPAVQEALAQALPALEPLDAHDFYVAGSRALVEASRVCLAARGVPPEQCVVWTPD